MPNRISQLGQRTATLTSLVRIAQEMAACHRPVDLTGLEDTIGAACAQALDLPPELAGQAAALLTPLDAALDRLQATLIDLAPPCG